MHPGIAERVSRELEVAWAQYWKDAHSFWRVLFTAYSRGGDYSALKGQFAYFALRWEVVRQAGIF